MSQIDKYLQEKMPAPCLGLSGKVSRSLGSTPEYLFSRRNRLFLNQEYYSPQYFFWLTLHFDILISFK